MQKYIFALESENDKKLISFIFISNDGKSFKDKRI